MATPIELFIEEMQKLFQPDEVYIMDGSQEEAEKLANIAQKSKVDGKIVLEKLNEKEYPNSYYHRSNTNDVARTEHLTFVCTPSKTEAGPNNNWMDPVEAKEKMMGFFKGAMKGRTMYVIPFVMGPPKSKYAKNCIQVTDSVYVALSMRIMARVGKQAVERIGSSSDFFRGVHSIGDVNPDRRFIMHFPQENLVMSFGSGYGGNALLGKKCYSLRIGSYLGYQEGWLAEHMIIIGVEVPDGKVIYFLGAFPSACGKTNLALLEPVLKGYKVWTLGDDIAWINVGEDGRLYAINPEAGFFGVAPGTGLKTNPIMIKTLKNDKFFPTLFTNTAVDNSDNTPWWEGASDEIPSDLTNWQGQKYDKNLDKAAAHPNSRFTVSIYNCPTLSPEYNNPKGVPISGIIFGGRRKDTIPLVYEAKDWNSGVFTASIIGSETTAASSGQVGNVRRDPMAMLPFCGYNMGEYFQHWINIGKKVKKLPKIFMVNWFRKDENGKFMWPGFRDNSRIIKWMIYRIEGKTGAKESEIGLFPEENAIDLSGLDIKKETMEKLLKVDKQDWKREVAMIEEFYAKFGDKIPQDLRKHLTELKKKLGL
ncbi:phosphoenolpyruvate carboxykinase (GTP) [Candidatus Endomicrobiellum trichonymphae]|uniref:phosphoenolpyruvate carboxykinase (GTP) n=1 Tax=Endomicrobium trichonymphae TaxID=1408204 RepID=UPI0008652813|nr:phosphoenolpyruvate carboxykinase (GTP) [Candidatus Endomicrobium trichonymphae]BAV58887.1 phosphoenolpyruvate carboxykinase [Candidatus Endomicrobium trichonymphae]